MIPSAGLAGFAADFEALKRKYAEARYSFGKTQDELEELVQMVHQCMYLPMESDEIKAAWAYLRSIARERQMLLEALSEFRAKGAK